MFHNTFYIKGEQPSHSAGHLKIWSSQQANLRFWYLMAYKLIFHLIKLIWLLSTENIYKLLAINALSGTNCLSSHVCPLWCNMRLRLQMVIKLCSSSFYLKCLISEKKLLTNTGILKQWCNSICFLGGWACKYIRKTHNLESHSIHHVYPRAQSLF